MADQFSEHRRQAVHAAHGYVTQRLKSPATAQFPYTSDHAVDTDKSGNFVVESYVDSENGFGANIRTHYRCTMIRLGDDKFVLVKFKTLK